MSNSFSAGRQQLADLIARVKAKRDSMPWPSQGPPPLLVKIAPDLNSEDLVDIAAVALDLKVIITIFFGASSRFYVYMQTFCLCFYICESSYNDDACRRMRI